MKPVRRRSLIALTVYVLGLVCLGATQLLRPAHGLSDPSPAVVQRIAEALPHTHKGRKTGETTGTIGYIDATNKIIVAQLKDGAIVKAMTAVPTERLRTGERVKVAYGVGGHGEQVFTVLGPAPWFAFWGG